MEDLSVIQINHLESSRKKKRLASRTGLWCGSEDASKDAHVKKKNLGGSGDDDDGRWQQGAAASHGQRGRSEALGPLAHGRWAGVPRWAGRRRRHGPPGPRVELAPAGGSRAGPCRRPRASRQMVGFPCPLQTRQARTCTIGTLLPRGGGGRVRTPGRDMGDSPFAGSWGCTRDREIRGPGGGGREVWPAEGEQGSSPKVNKFGQQTPPAPKSHSACAEAPGQPGAPAHPRLLSPGTGTGPRASGQETRGRPSQPGAGDA